MLILAILAFSSAAALSTVHATYTSPSQLPWATNALVQTGQLTVAGSSTVGPIATEEINQGNFVSYWNGIASGLGSSSISQVNLATLGSGTAVPSLDNTAGAIADVGEMSRPLSSGEYGQASMANIQQYAVGVDSVAIVLSTDMSWFNSVMAANGVSGLTTAQVAELFADNTPTNTASQGLTGVTGSTALYGTWQAFFTGIGWTVPSNDTTVAGATIQRAVRDPTSGTFDCFNNYFAAPNGYSFENKAITSTSFNQTTVVGTQEMAPFTYDQENSNIFNTVSTGTNYIGFISVGYLLSDGGPQNPITSATKMIGLNIAYNMASAPSGKTTSPIITYYGSSGTFAFVGSSVNPPTWGTFVQPTDANVIWAYSGVKGSTATGQYEAWRWLWEVLPGQINTQTTPTLMVAGVWVAYMMADGTTNAGEVSAAPTTGTSNFVADQNYIPLDRDDMSGAGANVLDSNLNSYTPVSTQTQSWPDGKVNFNDITYFVTAYIAYYNAHTTTHMQTLTQTEKSTLTTSPHSSSTYIAYYTTYNP